MPGIQILNTETLSHFKYLLEKVSYAYTDHNGKEQTAQREVYHRSSSAAILLYDPDRRTILLAEQLRLPTYLNSNPSGYLLEACAGMIEKDELPEQCIVRELEEEMGYRISEIEKFAEAYLSPAAITEYMHFFLGKYSLEMKVNEGGGIETEGEDIRVVELSFNEAREKLFSGEIHDTKTILLLQHAIIHGII